jgi:RNA-directed DNA polymerase
MGNPAATERRRLPSLSHAFPRDVSITGSAPAVLAQEVKPLVEHVLHARALELSQANTPLTPLENGFAFLGQHIRQYAGALLMQPAPQHGRTGRRHLRPIVQTNKPATAGHLIAQRHPVRRGWANSQRHVVSQALFITVAPALFQTLGAWATRRPPQ